MRCQSWRLAARLRGFPEKWCARRESNPFPAFATVREIAIITPFYWCFCVFFFLAPCTKTNKCEDVLSSIVITNRERSPQKLLPPQRARLPNTCGLQEPTQLNNLHAHPLSRCPSGRVKPSLYPLPFISDAFLLRPRLTLQTSPKKRGHVRGGIRPVQSHLGNRLQARKLHADQFFGLRNLAYTLGKESQLFHLSTGLEPGYL